MSRLYGPLGPFVLKARLQLVAKAIIEMQNESRFARYVVAWIVCLLILTGFPATAGTLAASVHGTVTDGAGRPIGGASILLANRDGEHRTVSAPNGSFAVADLKPGAYIVVVTALGFTPLNSNAIHIEGVSDLQLDLVMVRANASSLVRLGTILVNGKESLSTASAPTINLDPQDLAGRGIEQLSDIIGEQIGVTLSRPNGGGAPGAPQHVSLRGPDPSETLVDIDGHEMNNSNTGDLDLALLDPSEFSSVQIAYGIGPSSLVGANTQGGAVNFRTIEPTQQQHGLLRFSMGSFGSSGETFQATGTSDKIGYALSLHRYNSEGDVHNFNVTDDQSLLPAVIGNGMTASTALMKLRYGFGVGDGFLELTYRNTAGFRDLSGPMSVPTDPTQTGSGSLFTSFAGSAVFNNTPAYGVDLQLPLGPRDAQLAAPATLIVRHMTSLNGQTIVGGSPRTAVDLSPWLFSNKDLVDDDSVQFDRQTLTGSLTLGMDVRAERLSAPDVFAPDPSTQAQTQRSFLARYEWTPERQLHYTAAAYVSQFDTFGRTLDPRFAIVWTPTSDSVLRASVGSGFRAPLLAERFIPTVFPPQDARGFVNIGNPNLTAERTTQYELGYEHRFAGPEGMHASLNLYRTYLRNPIFLLIPQPIPCVITPTNPCLSFPINVSNVIYQGIEPSIDQPLRGSTNLHLEYGTNSAYPVAVPQPVSDPTAPTFVAGQQFQGIPLHKGLLAIAHRPGSGIGWTVDAAYEGINNQLSRPPHTIYGASVGYRRGHTDFALTGRNLGNLYDSRFTLPGLGQPYPGGTGPVPTDAFALQPRTITFTVTQHY